MTGLELIAKERRRQVKAEGRTHAHDDSHTAGELTAAAIAYARVAELIFKVQYATAEYIGRKDWPWHPNDWKPSKRSIDNLIKAGALIAAEIDRLQRMESEDY